MKPRGGITGLSAINSGGGSMSPFTVGAADTISFNEYRPINYEPADAVKFAFNRLWEVGRGSVMLPKTGTVTSVVPAGTDTYTVNGTGFLVAPGDGMYLQSTSNRFDLRNYTVLAVHSAVQIVVAANPGIVPQNAAGVWYGGRMDPDPGSNGLEVKGMSNALNPRYFALCPLGGVGPIYLDDGDGNQGLECTSGGYFEIEPISLATNYAFICVFTAMSDGNLIPFNGVTDNDLVQVQGSPGGFSVDLSLGGIGDSIPIIEPCPASVLVVRVNNNIVKARLTGNAEHTFAFTPGPVSIKFFLGKASQQSHDTRIRIFGIATYSLGDEFMAPIGAYVASLGSPYTGW